MSAEDRRKQLTSKEKLTKPTWQAFSWKSVLSLIILLMTCRTEHITCTHVHSYNRDYAKWKKNEKLKQLLKMSCITRTLIPMSDPNTCPRVQLGYFRWTFNILNQNRSVHVSYPCPSVKGPTRVLEVKWRVRVTKKTSIE